MTGRDDYFAEQSAKLGDEAAVVEGERLEARAERQKAGWAAEEAWQRVQAATSEVERIVNLAETAGKRAPIWSRISDLRRARERAQELVRSAGDELGRFKSGREDRADRIEAVASKAEALRREAEALRGNW